MAKKRGHYDGGKSGGRHGTVTDAATRIIRAIESMPAVDKIVPSIIKNVHSCSHGVKVAERNPVCLQVTVRGSCSIQVLYVHTSDHAGLVQVRKKIASLG